MRPGSRPKIKKKSVVDQINEYIKNNHELSKLEYAFEKMPLQEIVDVSGAKSKTHVSIDKKKIESFLQNEIIKKVQKQGMIDKAIAQVIKDRVSIHTHPVNEHGLIYPSQGDLVNILLSDIKNNQKKHAIYCVESRQGLKHSNKVVGVILLRVLEEKSLSPLQKKNRKILYDLYSQAKNENTLSNNSTILREYLLKTHSVYLPFENKCLEIIRQKMFILGISSEISSTLEKIKSKKITYDYYAQFTKSILNGLGINMKVIYSKDYVLSKKGSLNPR